MFFEGEKINLIDKTDEELTKFLSDRGLDLKIVDASSRYCAWGIYDGYSHYGLTWNEALSMGYMVSLFFAGMGMSCGTDYLYKEESIEYTLIDKLNELSCIDDEQKRAEMFYEEICGLYADDLDKYAYHRERINMMVSNDTLERFQEVEGATRNEKLINLIKNYYS